MNETDDPLELYRLYLASAERVSDRRAAANTWMLSVNAGLVGLSGLLSGAAGTHAWRLAIPVAGIIVCLAWMGLLSSYRKLNAAKFKVIQDLEARLPAAPFTMEEKAYRTERRLPFAVVETAIPLAFAGLYGALVLFAAG